MQFFLLIIFHGLSIGYCSNLSGFTLYHTDHLLNGLDRDCLYYFTQTGFAYQFIQYCVRSPLEKEMFDYKDYTNSFTFEDLRKQNITSGQLYNWSAPIDLIEHYQSYIENNTSKSDFLFYNCTFPWFGSRCEYSFDEQYWDFDELVEMRFKYNQYIDSKNLYNLSCYTHLECDRVGDLGQTPGACLDWREVCDGKVDCIDGGHDEELCWQLEINDCDDKTEFRCHNGLCIPLDFLGDDRDNADCIDRSDEVLLKTHWMPLKTFFYLFPQDCYRDPAFRCEDDMCHASEYRNYTIECGDGSYGRHLNMCANRRDLLLARGSMSGRNISNSCSRAMDCFTGFWPLTYQENVCSEDSVVYVEHIERY